MFHKRVTADYIRGFADGEGGFHDHIVEIGNTDWRLLERIRDELYELNIECTITRKDPPRGTNHEPFSLLRITGIKNLAGFAYFIGFGQARKQQSLENYLKSLCRQGREYNLKDNNEYITMSADGHSLHSVANKLGLAYNAIWKRVHNAIWPIPDELIKILEPFQP